MHTKICFSQILKHKSVTHIDFVELDENVINICKEYFPWGKIWSTDKRVKLHITDGAEFVRLAKDHTYDVIIQDSADPFYMDADGDAITLPSKVLYDQTHFQHMHRILTSNGVLAFQSESYNIPSSLDGVRMWRKSILQVGFSSAKYATIATSSYPTGQIGMIVCHKKDKKGGDNNKKIESDDDLILHKRFNDLNGQTSYYHPPLQRRLVQHL